MKLQTKNKPDNLPEAVIIGPMKAGTTWIDRYFRERTDIGLPQAVKETFFFDRNYRRGLKWYADHFNSDANNKITVEVSPSYFHSESAPAQIIETLGCVPLVVVLRDPVKRAYSHYLHQLRYGFTSADLRTAVADYPEIICASQYAKQLTRWIELFGSEKILILFQEDLAADSYGFVKQLCKHLGLKYLPPAENLKQRVNEAALPESPWLAALGQKIADQLRALGLYRIINLAKELGLRRLFFGQPGKKPLPVLEEKDREWLYQQLLPDIEALEVILDRDLSVWKSN